MKITKTPENPIPTFKYLDDIITILGGTKLSFWPFLSGIGTTTFPYGEGNDGILLTASSAIESILDPSLHVGGIHSVANDGSTSWLSAADNANFSFGDGSVDSAFSTGAWIMMQEALGTERVIMGKFRDSATSAREWDLLFTSSGKIALELFDESESASESGISTGTALTPFIWQFVVSTYDGTETAPAVNLYINATDVHNGTTAETNNYTAMENLTELLTIGHRDSSSANRVFQGRIALPFVCGKELTAANVSSLHTIGQKLLGLA